MSLSARDIRRSLRTDFSPPPRLRAIRALFRARQAVNLPWLLLGGRVVAPVFIVGAPRSGTSLLYALLRTSRHLAHWPGEAHEVWERDLHPALRGWKSNVATASDATPEVAARIRRSFALTTGPRRRLVDKTPRNSLRVGFVGAVFPDARFVLLQRDGRDNVNSLINAWRSPRYRTYRLPRPHSIAGTDPAWWKFVLYPQWERDRAAPLEIVCAHQWMSCNTVALDDLEAHARSRWIAVRYEDLVSSPARTVGAILEFLELPYEPAVRRRAEASESTPLNVVTPPERGKWRRENPDAVAAILPLIEPLMERLGYPTDAQ
jgi:Sulfotransferase family